MGAAAMTESVTGTDKLGHTFRVRTLEPPDRPHLQAMYASFEPKRAAQGLPPPDPPLIERWLDGILRQGSHVVVEMDSAVVGHGMLLPFAPGEAELANFLHQSVRDRGIGTTLNQVLVDVGRRTGLRRIWLSVQPSNRRAIRSYEKVGFRHRPATLWAPEIEMELLLDPPEPATPTSSL
jgi:ribosomal protein S18 acetylase RimI-like enzyme